MPVYIACISECVFRDEKTKKCQLWSLFEKCTEKVADREKIYEEILSDFPGERKRIWKEKKTMKVEIVIGEKLPI